MMGLLLGSVMFWGYMNTWPTSIFSTLTLAFDYDFSIAEAILPSAANNFVGTPASYWPVVMLTIDLFFIVIVLFSGLTPGMSHCAGLTREDGSTPRSRWLYFACGVGTMMGAFCGSGPVLLSGESIIGVCVQGYQYNITLLFMAVTDNFFCIRYFRYPSWCKVGIIHDCVWCLIPVVHSDVFFLGEYSKHRDCVSVTHCGFFVLR